MLSVFWLKVYEINVCGRQDDITRVRDQKLRKREGHYKQKENDLVITVLICEPPLSKGIPCELQLFIL